MVSALSIGRWTFGVRRFLPLLLISVSLISCARYPKATTPQYSAPSSAPVREKISAAKTWVSNAQGHADKAKQAVAAAQKLVGRDSVEPKNIANLKLVLKVADQEIDALTAQLLNAQSDLQRSDILIEDYEKQVAIVTTAANDATKEKNVALASAQKLEAQRRSAVAQRNKLFIGLLAAVGWIFKGPIIAGAGFVARKFIGIPI